MSTAPYLMLLFAAAAACDLLPRERTAPPAPAAAALAADTICDARFERGPLPRQLRETSGLAAGSSGRMWTHNDGREATLYALDDAGRVVQRVAIEGVRLVDWEDLESAPCDGGLCLYIADIGDNSGARAGVTIHIVPEPAPGATAVRPHASLHARYPDGARDAEALFVLRSGDIFIVTKGRHGAIELFRYPAPQRPQETVMLQRVRELRAQPRDSLDRVTAATAAADDSLVLVRSYRALLLYSTTALLGGDGVQPQRIDVSHLRQEQGESVAIDSAGRVWLTSESENRSEPAWARLRCRFATQPD